MREDGTVLVDSIYGSEVAISKNLLSVFTKGGIGAVYSLSGKKLFPAADESQTRPVKNIWISNDRFAVMDQLTDTFMLHSADGEELFTNRQIVSVKLSDGFLVTVSELGTLSLFDSELSLLTTDSSASNIQVSDEFAGFINSYGALRLFSRESGEFAPINNASYYSLTNTFALVKDSFGLSLYAKDKSLLENPASLKGYAVSHAMFAYVGNTGALWIKNEESGASFVVNQADAYSMSDDLLIVKNGMGDFRIYSLKEKSFGQVVHSFLDQTIVQFQAGNGIASFETKLSSSAANSLKVLQISDKVDASTMSVLVDEIRTGKVNLTVNREEWNWQ